MAAKAGRLQVQLEMQVAQLQRDLGAATRAIEKSANNWKSTFKGVFTADLLMNAVSQVSGAISGVIDDMGNISDQSKKLGDTAEMFQRIAYAADQSGVSMESVVSASNKLQKNIGESSKETEDSLRALGLSLEQLRRMSTGEAIVTVSGRLGEMADKGKQAAIGAQLLGKGFSALLPLVADGEEAMRRVMQQALVASNEAVKAGDDFGDMVARSQGAVKRFIAEAMAPLLPVLTDAIERMTDTGNAAAGMGEGFDKSKSSAQSLGETLATMFKVLNATRENFGQVRDMAASTIRGLFKGLEVGELSRQMDEFGKSWSRVINDFSDVQSKVESTAELATGKTEDQTEATNKNTEATTRNTTARRESNKEKEKEFDLDAALAGVNQRVEEQWSRTEPLLIDLAMAREEANQASRDELDILRLRLAGYSEEEIAIVEKTQAIRAATEESAENARRLEEEQRKLTDTIAYGMEDIFFSMSEGADQTKEAVARLVTELAALYLQMLAINTLKQFNANGTWGFQGVAKGAAFDQRGMMPFAQGGIVRSATAFTFGAGRLGVMGEAGPEAIMPLGRDGMGRLGVRGGGVTVNVHNNAGASVSVDQRGNEIAIIVDQVRGVIANDFARGGNVVTTAFEGAYPGVRR